MTNEISLDGLPRDIQDKILAILGKGTPPVKKITLQEALPKLDISDEKKKQILEILQPRNKLLAKDHERLEQLLKKDRSKPSNYRALQTIRECMEKKHGKRS